MFRNEEMTIPVTFLFNDWTRRSLCFEFSFLICLFSVVVLLLLFALFLFFCCLSLLLLFFWPVFGVSLCLSSVCFAACVFFGVVCVSQFCVVSVCPLVFLCPLLVSVSFWSVSVCVLCFVRVKKIKLFCGPD